MNPKVANIETNLQLHKIHLSGFRFRFRCAIRFFCLARVSLFACAVRGLLICLSSPNLPCQEQQLASFRFPPFAKEADRGSLSPVWVFRELVFPFPEFGHWGEKVGFCVCFWLLFIFAGELFQLVECVPAGELAAAGVSVHFRWSAVVFSNVSWSRKMTGNWQNGKIDWKGER